ncbi:MAG TPA: 16S rRNA (adenine(1518)-N(6)/adenine(1519)-N(6))-dimethyltransferase RsmA [Thermoleophilia bacterium]|nr:16S rRNA (adenine(1518)-N(6)/adenine(1519)-N(6))-dimethyltransferase RsmA [Thermoleophilia bacterium]
MSAAHARPPARRRYGQHHLVDRGTLEAILAMARVGPDDVVLEVGAGDGLLTSRLAEQARFVHAFEIDRRFAAALGERFAGRDDLRLYVADGLRYRLGDLDPAPTAIVANLAYNIAVPLIMRTIEALPGVRRWAVMLQRELAERLFAAPRTKAYSAVSVMVQLSCALEAQRPVGRTVFSPQPRVDSAFVTFTRTVPGQAHGDAETIAKLVRTSFGQRRKQLVNSLAGATLPGSEPLTRSQVQDALTALGLSETTRPEELAPPVFVALARQLGWLGAS